MDLAFHRGILTGTAFALQLLRPMSSAPRPKCPYRIWRPLRRLCWRLGFSLGAFQVLHRR